MRCAEQTGSALLSLRHQRPPTLLRTCCSSHDTLLYTLIPVISTAPDVTASCSSAERPVCQQAPAKAGVLCLGQIPCKRRNEGCFVECEICLQHHTHVLAVRQVLISGTRLSLDRIRFSSICGQITWDLPTALLMRSHQRNSHISHL